MRTNARIAPSAAVLLMAAFLCWPGSGAAAGTSQERTPSPLRNEDVVRMLVAGRPAAEVVAAIRAAETAFELSDEMMQELRLAGVPAEVLAAMAARQAEVDRARAPAKPPDAASEEPAAGKATIVVTLRSDTTRGGEKNLLFPTRLDDQTARTLQLGASADERAVTGLAVFLACRTADHVPDQWRSRSPLGRDFVSVARHQILDFRPEAGRLPGWKAPAGWNPPAPPGETVVAGPDLLSLALPVELRGEVEHGVAHDLVVGVAIRVGERFLELAEIRKDGVVPGAGTFPLAVVLAEHGSEGIVTIVLRFEESGVAQTPPR